MQGLSWAHKVRCWVAWTVKLGQTVHKKADPLKKARVFLLSSWGRPRSKTQRKSMSEHWGRITCQQPVGLVWFSSQFGIKTKFLQNGNYAQYGTCVRLLSLLPLQTVSGLWGWHTDVHWHSSCLLWGLSHFHLCSTLAAPWRQLPVLSAS